MSERQRLPWYELTADEATFDVRAKSALRADMAFKDYLSDKRNIGVGFVDPETDTLVSKHDEAQTALKHLIYPSVGTLVVFREAACEGLILEGKTYPAEALNRPIG